MNLYESLKKISEKINMTDEELKTLAEKLNEDAKTITPIKSNTGLMLPPEEYDRMIDKYLDEVFGKGSFR